MAYIGLLARGGRLRGEAKIDGIDLEKVLAVSARWWRNNSGTGYAYSSCILMHRLITDAPKGVSVDHINHDTIDNRRGNLRLTTQAENSQNRAGATKRSRTGVRNVYFHPRTNHFRVEVRLNRRKIRCGQYKTLQDAAVAAEAARRRYFTHSSENSTEISR